MNIEHGMIAPAEIIEFLELPFFPFCCEVMTKSERKKGRKKDRKRQREREERDRQRKGTERQRHRQTDTQIDR